MYYVFVQLINRLSIYFAESGAFVLAESGAFGAWVGLLRGCGLSGSVAATQLDKPLQILSLILGKRIAFSYTADGSNGVSFAQVDQPDTLGSTSCHTDVAYGHADGNT